MKTTKNDDKGLSDQGLHDSPSHLLHRVLQIALDIYNSETGEGALSQRQYAVLKALENSEGLSQSDLVRLTGIDRSTLADLVSRMLARDLLVRERSATDARANSVQLAEAGKQALAEMQPLVMAADDKLLALLSPPKRESFVKLLRKLVHARENATDDAAPLKDKPAKAEKPLKKKKNGKKAKKAKKLPFPPLSEGADETDHDDLVRAPDIKATT
ncbi:MAG: MarR family winged helix-turn-helix transcriptional regulator [Asticcacaulis sp.]